MYKKNSHKYNKKEIEQIKQLINRIKKQIENKLKNNINSHWEKITKEIDYKNTEKFFPKINKMFRQKGRTEIDAIKVANNVENKNKLNLSEDKYTIDNNYIILHNEEDIINAIGLHFEKINAKNRQKQQDWKK